MLNLDGHESLFYHGAHLKADHPFFTYCRTLTISGRAPRAAGPQGYSKGIEGRQSGYSNISHRTGHAFFPC